MLVNTAPEESFEYAKWDFVPLWSMYVGLEGLVVERCLKGIGVLYLLVIPKNILVLVKTFLLEETS